MASPWDILDIAPTPDAAAIRRAYARALKTCRPDEDADGFQRLVEARTRALAWHWADAAEEADDDGDEDQDLGGGLVVRLDEAGLAALLGGTARVSEGGDAGKPGQFDPVPLTKPLAGQPDGFARLHFGEAEFAARQAGGGRHTGFAPLAVFQPGQPDGLLRLLKRMAQLLRDTGSGIQWDGAVWRNLVRDAGEFDLSQRKRLRDAVIRDVLPRLPAVPPYERVQADFFADRGPAAAADVLEAEFAFSRDQARLAADVGQAATLCYLGWVEHARRELPPSRRTPGQQRALVLVAKLTGTDGAMNHPVRSAWTMEDCRELLALLAGMAPGEREPCIAALLHALGAKLPAETDESVWMYDSIVVVVGVIEDALRFEGAGRGAVPPGAVLPPQYSAWVLAASRLRAARARREHGAYRDGRGILVLPAEDADTGIWAHPRFGEYWAEARTRGRWPVRFDWQAFLFPITELAALGVGPNLGFLLLLAASCGIVMAADLVADGPALHWVAALCVAAFILARVPFAFVNRRAAIVLAMWRIRRADRDGVVSPRQRAARILAPTLGQQRYRRGFELLLVASVLYLAGGALDPVDRELQAYGKGHGYAFNGKHADAIVAFDRALQLNPRDEHALFERAVSQYVIGRNEAALAGFDRVIELDPQQADAYVYRALTFVRQKRYADALRDADKADQLRPGDPRILADRAMIQGRLGNRAAEIEGYTAVLAIAPRSRAALVNRGDAFRAAGDYRRAIADYTAALELPTGPAKAERANVQVARAWVFMHLGSFGPAVDDLRAATAAYYQPGWDDAQRSLGYAQFYAGAFVQSAEAFRAALNMKAEPYALLFWHLARARTGSTDLQTLQTVAYSVPKDWPYPVVQMFLGQLAPDALLLAATKDNERCEAAFYVGEWQLLHGLPEPAAALFRTAEAQCPAPFVEQLGAVVELGRLPP